MKMFSRIITGVVFFTVVCHLQVFADDCAPIKAEAERLFKKAQTEYKQENFEEAMELYERARRYYRRLPDLDCDQDPSEFAKKSMEVCKKNIAYCEENIEKQKKMKAKMEAADKFNLATKKFNEGIDLKKERKWSEALAVFEEAAELWNSVASGDTELAEKAKPRAENAEKMVKQAKRISEAESDSDY